MTPEREVYEGDIGATLKDARRRIGMDVKEAEERTKIRARYLRALEAEDWEVLPAPAYVRGFLRTYGALLGLDGERLADEFRRRHEAPAAPAAPASEAVLRRRSRPGDGAGPSRGLLIGGLALALVLILAALAILGSGGDEGEPTDPNRAGDGPSRAQGKGEKAPADEGGDPLEPIDIEIEALGSVEVCVATKGEALVDSQVLAEGTREEFSGERRYRVDLPGGGAVRVKGGGAESRLGSDAAASWEVNSNGIGEIDYAGPDCP